MREPAVKVSVYVATVPVNVSPLNVATPDELVVAVFVPLNATEPPLMETVTTVPATGLFAESDTRTAGDPIEPPLTTELVG